MNQDYPTPWNFSNTDLNLHSPNRRYQIVFENLNEIAMDAPLGGNCFILFESKKMKLHDWAGGPIVWHENGNQFAFPIWTKQRKQQIAVVDLTSFSLTIYKQKFRVLHLTHFSGDRLRGIDSPIYRPLHLDIALIQEEIETMRFIK